MQFCHNIQDLSMFHENDGTAIHTLPDVIIFMECKVISTILLDLIVFFKREERYCPQIRKHCQIKFYQYCCRK